MTAKFKPTDEQRNLAKTLSGYGITQEDISLEMGIDLKTLRKHFRAELDVGKARSKTIVAQTAYSIAVKDRNPAMVMFLCKTQLHWRETDRLELTGEDGKKLIPILNVIVEAAKK